MTPESRSSVMGPRRRALAGVTVGLVVALSGLVYFASQPRCIGDCDAEAIDCQGIETWVARVRAEEAWPSDASSLRGRTFRAHVAYRAGRPCGARNWAIDSTDPRIFAHVADARGSDESVTVTLRYRNPDADGDVVFLDAIGIEVSGWQALGTPASAER